MKRHFVWTLVELTLFGLLTFSSISLAEEGKWTKKADMPTPRMHLSTSVVNGKIYAIGGQAVVEGIGLSTISTVEEYDPGLAGEGGEGQGVDAEGKLVTSWGKIKANHENLKEREKARK